MLIKCPECELQVSNKAISCPHCGYPMRTDISPSKPRVRKNRRRRLPNGFGQISEIKNRNLRNPFRAMVSIGKDENGRPICKLLKPVSYFPTYNDAYAALVEYNKNPYDLEPSMTVKELYDKWYEEYKTTVKSPRAIRSAWSYCSNIYNMRVKDVRVRHIKGCMENGISKIGSVEKKPNADVKKRIKILFNMLLDYAIEYELTDRNYARSFSLSTEVLREVNTVKNKHIPYSDEEIDILWKYVDDKAFVDIILVQCYSGWRPQEIGLIEIANVDLDNDIIIGGMKTQAGINRVVPIHPRIRNIIEKKYKEAIELGSLYLFNYVPLKAGKKIKKLSYSRYQRGFYMVRDELKINPKHRPHDGRTHFITMAKKYGVDEYAIKYIVGHVISDITEKIYTQREFEWLKQEIQKIK